MGDLKIWVNTEFGELRVVDMNGEPWMVGKDVAQALGYANTKDALASHVDEEDKCIIQKSENATFDIPNRGLTIINESGLYSLVLSSKLPGAKRFRRWVTNEVLPSIRKTGSYAVPKLSKEMQALFLLDQRTVQQEARLTALENTMTVDYSQQQTLKKAVGRVVVEALGGKSAPAYNDPHVRGKLFSECNRDVQDWFRVNSVCNVPRKDFTQAVEYIQRWKPSTNSVMLIQQTNAQTSLYE